MNSTDAPDTGQKKSPTLVKRLTVWSSLTISVLLFLYCGFTDCTEPTQIGIVRNSVSGQLSLQQGGGWYLTPPWVRVARIDTRPMRVSVATAGRGFSAKLVQFDVSGWKEFVATEGFRYYWWANRISINFGYVEEHRGMKDILRGYAYSAKKYPFIRILNEYQQDK